MRLGCAWYPEHWPEERWPVDLALMARAGMDTVRVGEFAWSRLEPSDGAVDLDWLDRAITAAAAHGLDVVLCTPSAAPPAWLTTAHPEVLRVQPDGRRMRHGGRCHFNPAHPLYRERCARIAGAMAQRFGGHPRVIGWQIDNELSDLSCDELTRQDFQAWLRQRFAGIDDFNRALAATYWSQEYAAWEQIPIPDGRDNPGLRIAWRDFATDCWRGYVEAQAAAIRPHRRPGQFITTNATYEFARQDPHALFADLDLCAVDVYLGSGSPQVHLDMGWMGVYLAAARGAKRMPFWVMETQPGSIDWLPVNPPMDPGEVRRMVWHQIGHGADAVLFWQWRSAPNGQEQHHGCLLGQSGRPRPLYDEVAATGAELRAAAAHLAGTRVTAEVAVLWSNRDRTLIDAKRFHADFDPWRHLRDHYLALRRNGLDVDVVEPRQGLDGYRYAVAPHLAMLDDELIGILLGWVEAGGTLLLGPRSGTRDRWGSFLPSDPPGERLGAALGGCVREFYALAAPLRIAGAWAEGSAATWGEWLETSAPDTEVLLRYGEGHPWLAGRPALIARRHGRGSIAYLGTWPDEETLAQVAAAACGRAGVARPWGILPAGLEVCRRRGDGREALIVLNHARHEQRLDVGPGWTRAGSTADAGGKTIIPAGEVAVLLR